MQLGASQPQPAPQLQPGWPGGKWSNLSGGWLGLPCSKEKDDNDNNNNNNNNNNNKNKNKNKSKNKNKVQTNTGTPFSLYTSFCFYPLGYKQTLGPRHCYLGGPHPTTKIIYYVPFPAAGPLFVSSAAQILQKGVPTTLLVNIPTPSSPSHFLEQKNVLCPCPQHRDPQWRASTRASGSACREELSMLDPIKSPELVGACATKRIFGG